jgi:DNA-binding NtrC family response regulator
VRELENTIERALILGGGDRVLPEDLNLPQPAQEPAA